MKIAFSILVLFLLMTVPVISQDSTKTEGLRSIFMGLPIEKGFQVILKEAGKYDNLQNGLKEKAVKNRLVYPKETILTFATYPLYSEEKCTNCYISAISEGKERIISLVLNFEDFNQKRYNELLKRILEKTTPLVKKIEQNIGDLQNWGTLLLLNDEEYTPRIRIREPAKAYTQITIDYISVL